VAEGYRKIGVAMKPELRKTGISVVGDKPWGTHFCHFYDTKQDLLDTLVPYFKAGLDSKEFCLWVVSESELITVEEAKAALAQAVPDLDQQFAAGNIEILDGHDWYFDKDVLNLERAKSAWDARLKQVLALGYEGLRASADTFWLREKDWKDFCAYEKQVNDWISDQRMTVMCTYPLAKSGAAEILDVAQVHQFAIARRQGEWQVIESLELIQARAEIKRINDQLQRVRERTSQPALILRYGAAVLSVAAAIILTLWMRMKLGQSSTPIVASFLCAVMFTSWFGGLGPGLLAIALSLLAIAYNFAAPFNSFAVDIREIPRLFIFGLSALFVGLLSVAQRNRAESLGRARDVLDETVQELKRTNQALRTENTERERAETLLHVKEQEFRAIVENAPDLIARYDREFRRTYVNPAFAKLYDLAPESLIGKPIFSIIHEAGLDVEEEELATIRRGFAAVFETGNSYAFEITLPVPEGRRNYSVRVFPERDLKGSVTNVVSIARDVTESKRAEEQIRATSEQLRALSAKLQSAKEEEDIRIAREIHDEMGSTLTSLRWDLERFDKIISEANDASQLQALRAKIADMMKLTEGTIGAMRRIASELRPSILDDLGLPEAIEWQAQQFQSRTGIVCSCDCSMENLDFDPEQATAIFRVFQEALTNVLSHSRATAVEVVGRAENGNFVLTVSDNGRGITEYEKSGRLSLGILGMRERAHLIGGEFEIKGIEASGTVVTVSVPISQQASR
jgi:PAS domain S-box-containing protein